LHLPVLRSIYNTLLSLLAYFRIFCCVLFLVIAVPFLHLETMIFPNKEKIGFRYRKWFTSLYLFILNIKVKKSGEIAAHNALIVRNHRMMIDPVIVLDYCPGYIVSKAEVASYPILEHGARNAGVIFVRRDQKESRNAIKEKIGELLSEGKNVVLFPEGTVNTDRLTARFSVGSFEEAAKYGRPVIPVALDYKDTSVYWGANISLIQHFLQVFRKPRLETRLVIGSPIKGNDGFELMESAKNFIDNQLEVIRRDWETSQI